MIKTLRQSIEDKIIFLNIKIKVDWHTAIKSSNRTTSANITCILCGFVSLRQVDNLGRGKFQCNNCTYLKYKKEAELQNFNLISLNNINGKRSVTLECKVDNTLKVVQPSCLSNTKVKCKECRERYYKEKLAEKGCIFVKTTTQDKDYRLVFINRKGVEKTIQTSAIHTGEWVAEDSRWENPSKLYCFSFYNKNDNSIPVGFYFKIGISRYPEKRLSKLDLTHIVSINILDEYSSRFLAREFEHLSHLKYKDLKLSRDIAALFTNGLGNGRYVDGVRIRKPEGATEWFYSTKIIDVQKGDHEFK